MYTVLSSLWFQMSTCKPCVEDVGDIDEATARELLEHAQPSVLARVEVGPDALCPLSYSHEYNPSSLEATRLRRLVDGIEAARPYVEDGTLEGSGRCLRHITGRAGQIMPFELLA